MARTRTPLKQAEFDLKQALRFLRKAIKENAIAGFYTGNRISPTEEALLVVRNMLEEVINAINKKLSEVSNA